MHMQGGGRREGAVSIWSWVCRGGWGDCVQFGVSYVEGDVLCQFGVGCEAGCVSLCEGAGAGTIWSWV